MKAILISIRPQHVANILNGLKTIEIRKKFPKDYVGWVYIYATKDKKLLFDKEQEIYFVGKHNASLERHSADTDIYMNAAYEKSCDNLTGKVVARFWCDKVEGFEFCEFSKHKDNLELYNECVRKDNELCKKACISCVQMVQYLDTKAIGKDMFGKAIHITNLEIFDKSKEISEFEIRATEGDVKFNNIKGKMLAYKPLTRAPQSKCYIEV